MFCLSVVTGRNEVVAKVMFLQVCVCPQGGGCLPQCMLGCQTPPDQADPPGPWDQTDTPRDQADTPPGQADTPPGPGRHPPQDQADPPLDQADTPPPPDQADPPPDQADSSIRSTSGRYASYWNTFLLEFAF